jgi:hypothetical protein
MRFFGIVSLSFLAACGGQGAQDDTVDTVLVFTATPPPPTRSPSPRGQMNALDAALTAYSQKRISADSAAVVIVDHIRKTGRSINIDMDPPLQAAVSRKLARRPN